MRPSDCHCFRHRRRSASDLRQSGRTSSVAEWPNAFPSQPPMAPPKRTGDGSAEPSSRNLDGRFGPSGGLRHSLAQAVWIRAMETNSGSEAELMSLDSSSTLCPLPTESGSASSLSIASAPLESAGDDSACENPGCHGDCNCATNHGGTGEILLCHPPSDRPSIGPQPVTTGVTRSVVLHDPVADEPPIDLMFNHSAARHHARSSRSSFVCSAWPVALPRPADK
jgi:hypothetical protein